ncbi:GntR family transcriptional regulator, partial [Corallococcus sp. AB045]
PQEQASPEAPSVHEDLLGAPVPASLLDDALGTGTCVDERSLGVLAPAVEDTEALGVALRPHGQVCPIGPDSGTPLSSTVLGDASCGHDGGGSGRGMADDASLNLSDGRANGSASSGEGCLPPAVPPSGSLGAKCKAGGLFHGTLGCLGQWWERLLRLTLDAVAGAMLPRRMGQRTSG